MKTFLTTMSLLQREVVVSQLSVSDYVLAFDIAQLWVLFVKNGDTSIAMTHLVIYSWMLNLCGSYGLV